MAPGVFVRYLNMITSSWMKVTAWAAVLVAVAAGLYIVSVAYEPVLRPILNVLLPFSVAVALALLLDPMLTRLERRGLARWLSVTIIAAIFLSAVVVLAVFVVPAVARQADELASNLPEYYKHAESYLDDFAQNNSGLLRRFHLPTTAKAITAAVTSQAQTAVTHSFSNVKNILAELIGKAIWIVLIPIITVFLIADMDTVKRKALLLVPAEQRERTGELASSIGRVFGAYIRGLLSVAFIYGIACGVALAIWGMPYSVLLGAVAGVLSLVPYIGTISTLFIVALVAFVSNADHPLTALWVAVTILIINQLSDNILSPRVVGKAVGLHPALAILALLIGGAMFGLPGMILSVPIAASIQLIILEFYPPLRGPDEEPQEPEKPSILSRIFRRNRPEEDSPSTAKQE